MRITDKYVFFYKDWLSNYRYTGFFYPSKENPILFFTSTEQAFMYFKALHFGDYKIAQKIYNTTNNPNECRLMGRLVHNYDDEKWSKVRYQLFYDFNYQKYLQDKELRKRLLNICYDNKTFVEASPIDKIWGVGLDENNPLIDDEKNWLGKNYLGKILTDIRNKFNN